MEFANEQRQTNPVRLERSHLSTLRVRAVLCQSFKTYQQVHHQVHLHANHEVINEKVMKHHDGLRKEEENVVVKDVAEKKN